MICRIFRAHGVFCASHTWEVILAFLTLTACMYNVDITALFTAGVEPTTTSSSTSSSYGSATASASASAASASESAASSASTRARQRQCQGWREQCDGFETEYNAADVILMTIVRCSAVLYSYYQFLNLHKFGSKYILGIAGLFTVFSSFIFTSSIINFMGSEVSDLKDALFFFLLLIDLSKASVLAQLALSGTNSDDVTRNISRGMEILGPSITLDTLVKTLVIGVGTLSGVQRLEVLCGFAVMSVIVNYVVFMTFYPACLSLVMDLSRNGVDMTRAKHRESYITIPYLSEEDQKPNPVVQRVKMIMSTGLMLVHAYSRFAFTDDKEPTATNAAGGSSAGAGGVGGGGPIGNAGGVTGTVGAADTGHMHLDAHHMMHSVSMNRTDTTDVSGYIIKWLTMSADQIVILILLIALLIKFVFFEEREDLSGRLRLNMLQQQHDAQQQQLVRDHQLVREQQEREAVAAAKAVAAAAAAASFSGSRVRRATFSISQAVDATCDRHTQTDAVSEALATDDGGSNENVAAETDADQLDAQPLALAAVRPLDECVRILNDELLGGAHLTDAEIIQIVQQGGRHCPLYNIESVIGNAERGVKLRRRIIAAQARLPANALDLLAYRHFDYTKVMNVCCENVLGYVQIPVGYAGPLLLDGSEYYVPMATTEGALVASTNRGCKVLSVRGVHSFVEDIGMTRAPCVRFPSVLRASLAKRWIEAAENFEHIKTAFDSTSRFARLQECHIAMDGPTLYVRFRALTGDAMGMNMVSKGAEMALRYIHKHFADMQIISLSGNFCSDKKPAAINWIKGRGKRVICECIVPAEKLRSVLKTDARTLVQCNKLKNMAGSAMAGSIGGCNAHAANMVTAVFIACGQDPAQNVTSSNCSTGMECWGDDGEDLYLTCTMPSLEVGTVGGGTGLPGQQACLDMLGVRGPHRTEPAENAKTLAKVICATVMAGELSLMAALVNSDLVKSHMRHNRSSVAVNPGIAPICPQQQQQQQQQPALEVATDTIAYSCIRS